MDKGEKMKKQKILGVFTIIGVLLLTSLTTFAKSPFHINYYTGDGDNGTRIGTAYATSYNQPTGIGKDENGYILVADTYNNRILRIKDDAVEVVAGNYERLGNDGFPISGYKDGDAKEAMFSKPTDFVVDLAGNIYVSDFGNHAIRRVTTTGKVVTFAGTGKAGYKNGTTKEAMFNGPQGIALDHEGNIYIADSYNHAIRKISVEGRVSHFAGSKVGKYGYRNGSIEVALFHEPTDVAVDKQGNVYVADLGNQRIRKIDIEGNVTTVAGNPIEKDMATGYYEGGFKNGNAKEALFNFPKSIQVIEEDILLIADSNNHKVRLLNEKEERVDTVIGNLISGDDVGELQKARFHSISGIYYTEGELFVSDRYNNVIKRMKIDFSNYIFVDKEDIKNTVALLEPEECSIYYGTKMITFPDAKVMKKGENICVPIRFLFEKAGYRVEWIEETKSVQYTKGEKKHVFKVGTKGSFIQEGRTYISIEDLQQHFELEARRYENGKSIVLIEKDQFISW